MKIYLVSYPVVKPTVRKRATEKLKVKSYVMTGAAKVWAINWPRFTLHVVAFIPHEGHVLNLTLYKQKTRTYAKDNTTSLV